MPSVSDFRHLLGNSPDKDKVTNCHFLRKTLKGARMLALDGSTSRVDGLRKYLPFGDHSVRCTTIAQNRIAILPGTSRKTSGEAEIFPNRSVLTLFVRVGGIPQASGAQDVMRRSTFTLNDAHHRAIHMIGGEHARPICGPAGANLFRYTRRVLWPWRRHRLERLPNQPKDWRLSLSWRRSFSGSGPGLPGSIIGSSAG